MLKIGASTKNIATLRWLFSALALIPGGCVADIFGERAVSYNQEAATNKDKTFSPILFVHLVEDHFSLPI